MDFLEEVTSVQKCEIASWAEFLAEYNPKKKQIFTFFEGDEDGSFYRACLKRIVSDDCEVIPLIVGCKNDVIKLYQEIDWDRYNRQQLLFFIDRDLSYWLNEKMEYGDNLFITDQYSVENYMVTPQCFEEWLITYQGFGRAEKSEIRNMVNIFKGLISKFEHNMMEIMAAAVVAKRKNSIVKLSQLKISPEHTIVFNYSDEKLGFEIKDYENRIRGWGINIVLEENAIKEQVNQFIRHKEEYSVRGKWILAFMASIGEYMRCHYKFFAPSLNTDNRSKLSPTCSVAVSQCMPVLGHIGAESPSKRLREFFEKTVLVYLSKFN